MKEVFTWQDVENVFEKFLRYVVLRRPDKSVALLLPVYTSTEDNSDGLIAVAHVDATVLRRLCLVADALKELRARCDATSISMGYGGASFTEDTCPNPAALTGQALHDRDQPQDPHYFKDVCAESDTARVYFDRDSDGRPRPTVWFVVESQTFGVLSCGDLTIKELRLLLDKNRVWEKTDDKIVEKWTQDAL